MEGVSRSRGACRECRRFPPQVRDRRRRKKLIDALVWQSDWGESIDAIINAAEAAGIPLADLPCVLSRVDPEPHLGFEWRAFAELRTDRPVGLDLGAIPWSSIDAFAIRHGIAGDEFERFCRLIRALDIAERAYIREHRSNAQS
ncbi:hypothetical protein [Bradyrhizobium sp. SZCCHNR1020]|uniref:phage tail assembly chaperone n=1 Tax=Bradyrhizobium sp. SZCCHNR1020 TaxID=3057343 RepID=UPI002916AF58|nr:hypothetical protein [Bradyrhizobium sp. SZCCHNR1020]